MSLSPSKAHLLCGHVWHTAPISAVPNVSWLGGQPRPASANRQMCSGSPAVPALLLHTGAPVLTLTLTLPALLLHAGAP
eukprot:scaffold55152_cov27-Phaeocystis_antarctica.AAC.1